MKRTLIIATTGGILLATTVLAGPVEDLVAQLEGEGYTEIEVEVEDDVTEIEGVLDGMEREIEMNSSTGEILSDETEAVDSDDDAEDDDEDKDEDDADEDGDDEDDNEDDKDDA